MTNIVLGIFFEREDADNAVDELEMAGYNTQDISIVMKQRNDMRQDVGRAWGESVAEGALSGATTGGIIGGIAGLLVGIGAITIPGIGALLIGGPIAALLGLTGAAASTVSGAVTGGLAGSLIGTLGSLGLSVDEARVYERRIKEGGILLAVPALEKDEKRIRDILEDNKADQIKVISAEV